MVKLRSKHSLSEQIGSPEVETVNISIPSTSKLICEEVLPVSSSKLITPEQNMQSQVMMCTPTKISSLNKSTRLLSSIGVRKASELTPKAKKLYRVASSLPPSTNFNKIFNKCIFLLSNILPQLCHLANITSVLRSLLKNEFTEDVFRCEDHDTFKSFLYYVSKFHLFVWLKNINKIVKGKQKVEKSSDKMKIYAAQKFEKQLKYSKKMKNLKCLNII
ncbi:uncharacterized protein LOC130900566 [Diorhabda carinulata]|uniref:uncharacterized protein LOC130900566 n=1 Tax=Diorhabda carinulata TaxID=1163345 RepID=UPI0025A0CC78|nr:uncharacterized protein LOC130900566 [Diorhabda carinulata]